MKKTTVAIFSVSITAGTIYFGYDLVKQSRIKKLATLLGELSLRLGKELSTDELKKELDKLYSWDLRVLKNLTVAKMENQAELVVQLVTKVDNWHIKKRSNLTLLNGIIF